MRIERKFLSLALLAIALTSLASARAQTELKHRIDIILEKKEADSVRVMDPTHVFAEDDQIRFRLRSSLVGFLYVINQGSSGKFEQLFPGENLDQSSQVAKEKEYLIPPSDRHWFKILGPPGYETVYFLVSPVDLGRWVLKPSAGVQALPSEQPHFDSAFAAATPRCDDELFRARGECLDSDAGIKVIPKGESLPERLPQIRIDASRDIVSVDGSKATSISSPQPFDEPAIYCFRIAHK